MTDRDALFAGLRRWPDVEDAALQAHDASDALILDQAAGGTAQGRMPAEVVVIGDRHGALTLGALHDGAERVRVHQDSIVGERALDANAAAAGMTGYAHHQLDASLVEGARLVLLQLPRSLDELDEIAELVATHADERVVLVAGGRVKHMSMSMNALLGRSFRSVHASLGWRKSRVLRAQAPRRPGVSWPRTRRHDVAGEPLIVAAHGGAFAGTSIDIGAQTLLAHLPEILDRQLAADAPQVVDLACGTGVLGVALALAHPDIGVLATDASAAAVASAAARVVVVALLCHLLLVVLVGRRDWRGSVAVVARASRVLALAPAFALLVVAWGVGLIGEVTEPLALAHKAMTGWLALQAGLWGWVLLRVPGRLRVEHEVSAAVAWFVGLAPAWALGLTAAIEAAL